MEKQLHGVTAPLSQHQFVGLVRESIGERGSQTWARPWFDPQTHSQSEEFFVHGALHSPKHVVGPHGEVQQELSGTVQLWQWCRVVFVVMVMLPQHRLQFTVARMILVFVIVIVLTGVVVMETVVIPLVCIMVVPVMGVIMVVVEVIIVMVAVVAAVVTPMVTAMVVIMVNVMVVVMVTEVMRVMVSMMTVVMTVMATSMVVIVVTIVMGVMVT